MTNVILYGIIKTKLRLKFKEDIFMKKLLSTILACVLLLGCVFTLAGCVVSVGPMTMISGTYELDAVVAGAKYDFGAFGKVTVTVELLGAATSFEGKYKVNNKQDPNEITFTFEDEDAKEYSGTFDFASGEEDGVKYIKIGLLKYNEVK